MGSTILKTFEVYQSYIYHRYVRPVKEIDKNKNRYFAFLTLMNDKWYYEQLKSKFTKGLKSKKPKYRSKNKRAMFLHEKEALYFNKEPRMTNESKFEILIIRVPTSVYG